MCRNGFDFYLLLIEVRNIGLTIKFENLYLFITKRLNLSLQRTKSTIMADKKLLNDFQLLVNKSRMIYLIWLLMLTTVKKQLRNKWGKWNGFQAWIQVICNNLCIHKIKRTINFVRNNGVLQSVNNDFTIQLNRCKIKNYDSNIWLKSRSQWTKLFCKKCFDQTIVLMIFLHICRLVWKFSV